MPWEIDYAMLCFIKLKKSSFYLDRDIEIHFDCVLNLSDYLIDWNKSKISKDFFINKFNSIKTLMSWSNINRYDVYTDNKLYGHLNLQKESISNNIDGYLYICPDINFNEYLLSTITSYAKTIKNKYYIITPEIYKMWDRSWDIITNENYIDISFDRYDTCNEADTFKIECENLNSIHNTSLKSIPVIKMAGWFDLYNTNIIHDLFSVPEEWNGYGAWDFYCILISEIIKKNELNIDLQQYVIQNQVICPYQMGKNDFVSYYKNLLFLHDTVGIQKKSIENTFKYNIDNWLKRYNDKKF